MSKLSRTGSLIIWVALLVPGTGLARDPVEVKLNAETAKFCHVARFPRGWERMDPNAVGQEPIFEISTGQYEFRVPAEPAAAGTRFLVRGFTPLGRTYYTKNLYIVDLADPAGVAQPATEEEWKAARVVPNIDVQNHEFHYVASGNHGGRGRLSPDRALLILQSWKGTLRNGAGIGLPPEFRSPWPFSGIAALSSLMPMRPAQEKNYSL